MSWLDGDDGHWDEQPDELEDVESRVWPLDWRSLYPRERWMWFEQLWTDVCSLRERYRLAVRAGWRPGCICTTRATGPTRPASSRCSTTSSASDRCCAMAPSRFTPTATGSRSLAT